MKYSVSSYWISSDYAQNCFKKFDCVSTIRNADLFSVSQIVLNPFSSLHLSSFK
jgi:hypothetical protein